MTNETALVTGGCGFIGSALVRHLHKTSEQKIVVVDSLTYAGNLENIRTVRDHRLEFVEASVTDQRGMTELLGRYKPITVFHLAAETHVDRSIDTPQRFFDTNVMGTLSLLEAIRATTLPPEFRLVHISTDEVFGELGAVGSFSEEDAYRPRSPYAASKASADHLVQAWQETYRIPAILVNLCNNYGPYQYPEKLIPLLTIRGLRGQPMPIYGAGEQIREWLFVDDAAEALALVAREGRSRDRFNVGSGVEKRNIDVARSIAMILDQIVPKVDSSYGQLIQFVDDRPGHDFRYALDSTRIGRELKWRPTTSFEDGLERAVRWLCDNRQWWDTVGTNRRGSDRRGFAFSDSQVEQT
ncbi:MAG: dTDP-glucose 4,6-dehydratase [Alphaproteobacteria bacterium]|nr:dTDP-glucose 4,6-dehydratase [Alphaproteobacteria bacterium]